MIFSLCVFVIKYCDCVWEMWIWCVINLINEREFVLRDVWIGKKITIKFIDLVF